MDYTQACEYLLQRLVLGIKPGLARMQEAAAFFLDPQNKYKTVLVAGTNGKGSTTRAISSLLHAQGYKIGTYLSPHLVDYTERFLINGEEISQSDFARLMTRVVSSGVLDVVALTEFELITLLAFFYFEEQQVDYAILEIGLGGRLDATNIVSPICSVITPIGLDHMDILGNTLAEIASEKAGIIKKWTQAFTAQQEPEAMNVLQHKAMSEYAELRIVLSDNLPGVQVEYQKQNFSLAFAVADFLLSLDEKSLTATDKQQLIADFAFPGRFEMAQSSPLVILDGAHNALGMRNLLLSISARYPEKKVTIILGILKRKAADEILDELVNWKNPDRLKTMVFVNIPGSDSHDPAGLAKVFQAKGFQQQIITLADPLLAQQAVIANASPDDLIVFCGSLYLIGYLKANILFD